MVRAMLLTISLLIAAPFVVAQDAKPAQPEAPKQAGGVDLADVFKKLDKNNDGKLSPDEFKAMTELPEFKGRLAGRQLPGNLDLEALKEKLGPERFEKIKERFGGKIDIEKIKEMLEKRKNKNP